MEYAYAHALWRLIDKGETPHTAVQKIHQSLVAHGRTGLLPKIKVAFERLAARRSASDEARLYVAREKDAHHATKEVTELLSLPDGNLSVYIDDTLIGGWRYLDKDRLVDTSYKQQLLALYNAATR